MYTHTENEKTDKYKLQKLISSLYDNVTLHMSKMHGNEAMKPNNIHGLSTYTNQEEFFYYKRKDTHPKNQKNDREHVLYGDRSQYCKMLRI